MKVAVLILVMVVFVILVITYPFKFKGAVHINALENIGFAVIKVLNIRLFNGRFKVDTDGKFSFEKEKNKKKKKNKTFKNHYFLSLSKRVDVKKAELFFNGGLEDDACLVSMACGYINVFVLSIFAVFMSKYKQMKTFVLVEPEYDKNRLELTASGVITFSLLDMFLSAVNGLCFMLKERGKK